MECLKSLTKAWLDQWGSSPRVRYDGEHIFRPEGGGDAAVSANCCESLMQSLTNLKSPHFLAIPLTAALLTTQNPYSWNLSQKQEQIIPCATILSVWFVLIVNPHLVLVIRT